MKILLVLLITAVAILGQESVIIKDIKTNKNILIGISNRKAYQDSNFASWFNAVYKNYDVDTNTIKEYKSKINNKTITIILGTWCSDSKREVPSFLKILDYIKFPQDSLKLINVDRDKHALDNEVNDLDIELVPTIIVYDKGEEIGRIVETPVESLEMDLVKIVDED